MQLTPEGFPSLASVFIDKEFSQKAPCVNHWKPEFLFPLPGDVQVYLDGVKEGIFPIPTPKEMRQGADQLVSPWTRWTQEKDPSPDLGTWESHNPVYFMTLLPPCIFEALFQKIKGQWSDELSYGNWMRNRNQFPESVEWIENQLKYWRVEEDHLLWKQKVEVLKQSALIRPGYYDSTQGYLIAIMKRMLVLHMLKRWQFRISTEDYGELELWQQLLAHLHSTAYKQDLQRAFIWCWKIGWLKEHVEWKTIR